MPSRSLKNHSVPSGFGVCSSTRARWAISWRMSPSIICLLLVLGVRGRGRLALGDGHVARGPVRRLYFPDDDPDALQWSVDRPLGGFGQFMDQPAHLLGGPAGAEGDVDEGHVQPPASVMVPRLVKCAAMRAPGFTWTASVMPPVSTIQPGSMARPRSARLLAARAR